MRALNGLSTAARAEFVRVWSSLDLADRAAVQRVLMRFWPELVGRYGEMAAVLAGDVFELQADDLGIEPPEIGNGNPLRGLDVLTPGDFAAIARRHRFEPFQTVDAVVAALRSECALKEDGRRGRMGFI